MLSRDALISPPKTDADKALPLFTTGAAVKALTAGAAMRTKARADEKFIVYCNVSVMMFELDSVGCSRLLQSIIESQ